MVITGQTVSDEVPGVGGIGISESSAFGDSGESTIRLKGFTT